MKVRLMFFIDNEYINADIHEDFCSIATDRVYSGSFQVAHVDKISWECDEFVVYAQPIQRDFDRLSKSPKEALPEVCDVQF